MRLKQLFCLTLVTAFLPAVTAQTPEELRLTVGKSIVLDYTSDIRQISTSDPAIVDAVAVSTQEVLLHAKATGVATVIVWPQSGQRSIYAISVEQNLDPLRRLLKETLPAEDIQVQSSRDSLSLTGSVSAKDMADRAVALATPFAKTIVNNLRIAVPPVDKQILLRVKFAELNRSVGQSFAVNLVSTGAAGIIGGSSTGQFSPPRIGELNGGTGSGEGERGSFSISDALNVFAFRPELNIGTFLRELESEVVMQILEEPNLVTTSGIEASFLVGGEFPIPVLQAGAAAGAITIQFREFGIRLTFNPTVTANNTIKMHVRPEVSTVDLANAL